MPRIRFALAALLVLGSGTTAALELKWFGQAAFRLTTETGKVILIDPFLTKNPKTPEADKALAALGQVDLILVTHGHGDHVGDTAALVEMTGAMVAMTAALGQTFVALGILPKDRVIRFNKSGSIRPLGDGITITMVRAEHSSELVHTAQDGSSSVHPGGEPAGFVIELEDGFTLYHAGDTGVFGDMRLIAEIHDPDLALLPIGGHFTMDPAHAAYAVRHLLRSRRLIPMHYGTFAPLKGTPAELREALGDFPVELIEMSPGETRKF